METWLFLQSRSPFHLLFDLPHTGLGPGALPLHRVVRDHSQGAYGRPEEEGGGKEEEMIVDGIHDGMEGLVPAHARCSWICVCVRALIVSGVWSRGGEVGAHGGRGVLEMRFCTQSREDRSVLPCWPLDFGEALFVCSLASVSSHCAPLHHPNHASDPKPAAALVALALAPRTAAHPRR